MLSEDRRRELHGDTPLLYAARVGDVKSLKKLLADGAKIDEPKGNQSGITPLMIACANGQGAGLIET